MLIAMAALHGSGYGYVAGTIDASQLPAFLKRILPPLYLYPSVLMVMLAFAVLFALRQRAGRAFVLGFVAAVVAANAVLGFVLGGMIPGVVLLGAAGVFGVASMQARRDARPSRN